MCARSDQSGSRDPGMDRLIADALKPRAGSRAAGGADCPDPEILAAYADHGIALGSVERHTLETHLAACAHCREVLSALGLALEAEAPAGASVAAVPAPVASAPARQTEPQPERSSQRWLWWLTPAFGAAAAGLLWMALRPATPQPVQSAANYQTDAAPLDSGRLSEPAAPPERQRAAEPRAETPAADRLSKTESASKETADATRERDSVNAIATATVPSTAPATPPAAPPVPPPPPDVRSEIATAGRAQAAPAPAGAAAEGRFTTDPAVADQAQAAAPAPAPGPVATLSALAQSKAIAGVAAVQGSPAQLNLYSTMYTFASPLGGAQWRVGPAGRIEKSTDAGRTWQQQSSGVNQDLLAGTAATNEVAWVVGRAGIILRTTDGQQWQRIPPPAGMTADWVTIVVRSATSATVVGAIRRFATEDGGVTWTEQQ